MTVPSTEPATVAPTGLRRHRRTARDGRMSVAGAAGGVGTTTVAAALGASDRGVYDGRSVDVLVCRATGDSLVRVGRAAHLVTGAAGRKPVIAVVAADVSGPSRPVSARLRLLEPHAAAVVVLPFVRRWRDLTAPLDEVRTLLVVPPDRVPRPLRRYAGALHDLRHALSGRRPTAHRPAPGSGCSRRVGRSPVRPAAARPGRRYAGGAAVDHAVSVRAGDACARRAGPPLRGASPRRPAPPPACRRDRRWRVR